MSNRKPVWRGDVLTFHTGDGHFAAVYDWNKGKWFLRLQWEGKLVPCFTPDRGCESEIRAGRWLWLAEHHRKQDKYNGDPPWPHPGRSGKR